MTSTPPTEIACPRCGGTVGGEQSWCLTCGAPARTRMRPTPNWRIPIATIAALIIVVAGATVGAFVALTTNQGPAATVTLQQPPAAPAAPPANAPAPPTTTSGVPATTAPGSVQPPAGATTTPPAASSTPAPAAPPAGTGAQPGARLRGSG